MKHLSLGYIVDHPKRDLPGAVQFARAALARGCDAYIIPMYDQAFDIPLVALDAVVVNFARPANLDVVQAYQGMGLPVYVMDTEGGNHTVAGSNTPGRLAELLRERGFSRLLSGYFFWGSALRDVFAEHCGMPPERLIATGCPRFDYASSRWQPVLRKPEQGYVLVNSNYPMINPRFSSSLTAEREAMVAVGWEGGYVDRLIAELKAAFKNFTENVARLARDLPELHFVYRPHPFENVDFYKERFVNFPNVRVDGSGDALTAISNARCVLHLNCATAIEATMLRTLPISLEYLNTPTLLNHAPLPSQISKQAHSYEDAVAWLRNTDAAAASFAFEMVHEQYVYPWFHRNDGGASDRIVDALLQQIEPRKARPFVFKSMVGSRSNPRLGQCLQGITANLLGSLAASRLRATFNQARRDKQLDADVIARNLHDLSAVSGEATPVVCNARHPVTGLPLASVHCRLPAGGQ
jgi:surface carbohydrate biosynthesis protein